MAPGEVVLVTGASGCGKSTLALALCGLIPSRLHGELRGRVMVDWCLDVTGLGGLRQAATVTLSGGQKQRTAIAATLAMRPGRRRRHRHRDHRAPGGRGGALGRPGGADGRRPGPAEPAAARGVGRRDPWLATGVGIPDLVRLAHAVPDAFPDGAPLSVDEAV